MKKNHQSGFMLAEAFIVATVVLGVMVFMFLQIKTIINGYDRSFRYNTIPGIYHTKEIVNFIKNNTDDYNLLQLQVNKDGYVVIDSTDSTFSEIFKDANVKTFIMSTGDMSSLKNSETILPKFQKYIKTLTTSINYKFIIEFNDDTYASIEG